MLARAGGPMFNPPEGDPWGRLAKFLALASPGEPLVLECKAKQTRKMQKSVFCRYDFVFSQGTTRIYEGDQSAMWMRPDEAVALLGKT